MGLDATGALSITATANAGGGIARRAAHAARRAFSLWSGEPDGKPLKADPARRRRADRATFISLDRPWNSGRSNPLSGLH